MNRPELIIFARQPIPGQVKTRLQPDYSPEQAAEIAAFMIRATVELALSAWPGPVSLYASPDPDHPLLRELGREFHLRLVSQSGDDLGARMLHALREGIGRAGGAAILGCDIPHCGRDVLERANDRLARGGNVLGPTEDGGYYFIGLREARPELFADMPWGSDRVLPMTLARAAKLGVAFDLLATLRDIDTAEDLRLAARKYAPLRKFL